MTAPDAPFHAFSADGHAVQWNTWDDAHTEAMTLAWDNEAWTATGHVGRENVQYVLRVSPTWQVRQFLLFRDLDAPDLWLATDARHRWGEVNGAFRPEFGAAADIELNCTPFPATIPIRRLALGIGEVAEIDVITIDVETLGAVAVPTRYERTAQTTWRATALPTGDQREFEVDGHGLVIHEQGRFRRQPGNSAHTATD